MLNDKDMDVLIRRYAQGAAPGTPMEHPDADELNSFAEGSLPAAARQKYLSHFADCDDCRKLVSQLAITARAGSEAQIPASEAVAEPWWRKLSVLFAPATMRYAAFAVVLLAVVGIAFLVWRPTAPQRNADMVAQNQPVASPADVLNQPENEDSKVARGYNDGAATPAAPQPTVTAAEAPKPADSSSTAMSPPPPPPTKETDALAAKAPAPLTAGAARVDDAPRPESSPSYAPAPPAEKLGVLDRERAQQNANVGPGGPRRNETYDKYRNMDRSRSGDLAKERDENQNRAANQAPAPAKKQDDSGRAQSSTGVAEVRGGARQESKDEARKSGEDRERSEEEAQTRSVAGRKFTRQGNVWIDSRFKSSMSVRTVKRGSDDFDELDSGLRSIANQLGGEIVVVWKGKAYRIK